MSREHKLNKSFSRRVGKSLSKLQGDLLANSLPKYLLDPASASLRGMNTIYIAEIGIGMGDHFVARAALDPEALHIGFEPYLNGVANSLRLAEDMEVKNILLWPDDMDLVFDKLPDNLFDEIYVLFPDPWPKLRHQKRRIINSTRLRLFAQKLKPRGRLHFASDIDHYFNSAQREMQACGYFEEVIASEQPPLGYIKTRYNLKAEDEGRTSRFLCARRSDLVLSC